MTPTPPQFPLIQKKRSEERFFEQIVTTLMRSPPVAEPARGFCLRGQHRELGFHHRDVRLLFGVAQGLFGALARRHGLRLVQILGPDGGIRQDRHRVRLNLKDTPRHENVLFRAIGLLDLQRPRRIVDDGLWRRGSYR
ncbi:hypothetical protein CDEF62S_03687 [Castellaniella defragrans]